MYSRIFVGIFALLSVLGISLASRILVLHPSPSISHVIVARSLVNELARRGHKVTMFSQFPQKSSIKNLRDIKVEVNESLADLTKNFVNNSGNVWETFKHIPKLMRICSKAAEAILEHPEFKRLVKEEKFDLVIVGMFTTNFMFGAAGYFDAPQIGIFSAGVFTFINQIVGNPLDVSAVPNFNTNFKGPMSFSQRIRNFLVYGVDVGMTMASDLYQNIVYKRNFPTDNFMSYDEAKSNVSLILVNNHFSQDHIRPLIPGLIEVGGLQIKEQPSPLPEHLQKWIDGAEHGIIYFSLGSNAKSNLLPKEKIDILMKTFAKLKQRVIFKWESNELPGKPDNVLTDKWLPQDDILANEKVQLFISHCGLGGLAEAKFHGVPIICMAIFGDQMANAVLIEKEGWGLSAPLDSISEDSLTKTVKDVLENPKYKSTVQKLSKLLRDRPNSALETAVFCTEYVIRHRGAPHMHYPGADLNFFQKNSLDVIAVLSLVLYVFGKIVAFLFRRVKAVICCLIRLAKGSPKQSLDKKKN